MRTLLESLARRATEGDSEALNQLRLNLRALSKGDLKGYLTTEEPRLLLEVLGQLALLRDLGAREQLREHLREYSLPELAGLARDMLNEASHVLCERFKNRVTCVARSVLGSSSTEQLVRDVVQSAFLAIHAGLKGLRSTQAIYSFVVKTTRNVALQSKERERKAGVLLAFAPDVPDIDPDEEATRIPVARPSLSAEKRVCEQSYLSRFLDQLVPSLTPRERQVLESHFLEDKSADEVMDEKNMKRSNFDLVVFRIRQKARHTRERLDQTRPATPPETTKEPDDR